MSVRLNHEAFGTYETTNERKGTLYSTIYARVRRNLALCSKLVHGGDRPKWHYAIIAFYLKVSSECQPPCDPCPSDVTMANQRSIGMP
jgi:hypothetical protein